MTQYDTVERLLIELTTQYSGLGEADKGLAEIKVIHQNAGESAGDYGVRVQTLHNRLLNIYDASREMRDWERSTYKNNADKAVLEQFLFGLNAIIYLYNSVVMPHFVYCCQIWSPFTQSSIHILESVQHKFIRYIAYNSGQPMAPIHHVYTPFASQFDLPTLHSIHRYPDGLLTFKLRRNLMFCPPVTNPVIERNFMYNLRNHRLLQESQSH